ncbi:MAG: YdcH family protein [Deltaproteobacteria bacterium]|nr:YdcH family protein [Deltaproteobacteria bacterium]
MQPEFELPADGQARFAEAERLRREHGELKARLSELNSRVYLSPQEELERKTLQKLKLAKKDRIAALLVSYSGNS